MTVTIVIKVEVSNKAVERLQLYGIAPISVVEHLFESKLKKYVTQVRTVEGNEQFDIKIDSIDTCIKVMYEATKNE